ncbi:MAG TPA: pentapeptide repeat-containing protein [Desulfomonilaceae bacterium]|nr:pentapeptide repeat-containing protein [Desulfomonilaceae bacterium]
MLCRTVTIKAIEAVKCIRAGMDDAALMQKFNISSVGLQSLFKQLETAGILHRLEFEKRSTLSSESVALQVDRTTFPLPPSNKPVIDAAEALKSIKEGIDDAGLMKKYNLSIKGVQSLLKKLVMAGALREQDVTNRLAFGRSEVVIEEDNTIVRSAGPELDNSEVAKRVRSGADRKELMEMFKISGTRLQNILEELRVEGSLSKTELAGIMPGGNQHFEIRNHFTGDIIFQGESYSFAQLVEHAVSRPIDLSEADFYGADLSRCDLSGGRFCRAYFRNARLVGTDFTAAHLSEADLVSSNLSGAVLYKANLAGADLSEADMMWAYAVWAFLPGANLSDSNLSHANFAGAHLANARFFETIMKETNFVGAYLDGVSLDSMKIDLAQ